MNRKKIYLVLTLIIGVALVFVNAYLYIKDPLNKRLHYPSPFMVTPGVIAMIFFRNLSVRFLVLDLFNVILIFYYLLC
jgi:hypothetical protein